MFVYVTFIFTLISFYFSLSLSPPPLSLSLTFVYRSGVYVCASVWLRACAKLNLSRLSA